MAANLDLDLEGLFAEARRIGESRTYALYKIRMLCINADRAFQPFLNSPSKAQLLGKR